MGKGKTGSGEYFLRGLDVNLSFMMNSKYCVHFDMIQLSILFSYPWHKCEGNPVEINSLRLSIQKYLVPACRQVAVSPVVIFSLSDNCFRHFATGADESRDGGALADIYDLINL